MLQWTNINENLYKLIGLTCVWAIPTCTEDDVMKCSRQVLNENATEEQLLDRDCEYYILTIIRNF